MITNEALKQSQRPTRRYENDSKVTFGFWVYLMTDCILFASIFATFAVLQGGTFGGPSGADIFNMPLILTATLILLFSSFTCGLGMLALQRNDKNQVIKWFILTFILGLAFLGLELYEFSKLIHEGNSWQRSGFLSAFFVLVSTHGLHITAGLMWIVALLAQVARKGLTPGLRRKLTLLSLFWHFLDIIWILIFTIVYLFGIN